MNERAIEDLLDTIEKDRLELDVGLRITTAITPRLGQYISFNLGYSCDNLRLSGVLVQDDRRHQGDGPSRCSLATLQHYLQVSGRHIG